MPVPEVKEPSNKVVHHGKNGEELDPSDPRVKKLVYSMYRDMLTGYRDEASAYVETQDPLTVVQDYGVLPIIQTILRGGSSSDSAPTASEGGQSASSAAQPPPPPPPMAPPSGAIPAVRLNSEIGPRDRGPPAALAGAMMKDKKPFTYTPGGIDLSEIRSPRMAKRLQMNAAAEGVTSEPKPKGEGQGKPQSSHHGPLPPAAQAAMQGQMAFCVFPQGAPPTLQHNRSHKSSHDYRDDGEVSVRAAAGSKSNGQSSGGPPPPPPPQPPQQNWGQGGSGQGPPPPPPMAMGMAPPPNMMPPQQSFGGMHPIAALFKQQQLQKQAQNPSYEQEEDTQQSPPAHMQQLQQQPRPISSSSNASNNVGKGSIYIQPLSPIPSQQLPQQQQPAYQQSTYQQRQPSPPPPPPRSPQPQRHQTKAQAASQNLGSIYIPPITPAELQQHQHQHQFSPPQQQMSSSGTPPSSGGSSVRTPQQQTPPQPQGVGGITTPQLKKTPTPWMNSYNKMATKQAESPPYVNPGNISTPWGTIPGQSPANGGSGGMVYTIPIALQRDEPMQGQGQGPSQGPGSPDVMNKAKAAQHLGRVIPIQIQRQTSLNKEHQIQAQQELGWPCPRTIPIQIEGRAATNVPSGVKGPSQTKRGGAPVAMSSYNTPMGLYSGQNVAEAYNQQQAGGLSSGVNNMTMADQEREPIQSKSMRVIQKAAENELRRLSLEEGGGYGYDQGSVLGGSGWPQYQQHYPQEQLPYWQQQFNEPSAPWRMDEFLLQNQQNLHNCFSAQPEDEGHQQNVQNQTEPRFRGGHIPSKAFKTLQTNLPPQQGPTPQGSVSQSDRVLSPQQRTSKVQVVQSGSGPVMHNIPIQMSSSSPTPGGVGSHSQKPISPVPPSEQRAPSPKKYMGPNIPGRSFKILQAMTAPDDPDANPTSFDASSSDTFSSTNSNIESSSVPSSPCPSPCPSSYMSWYYWWYYVSCYWAGYDMTGYDYPQGWDPNDPYFPPELGAMMRPEIPEIVVQDEQDKDFCDSEYFTETEDDGGGGTLDYGNINANTTPTPIITDKSEYCGWSEDEVDDNRSITNTAIIEEPSSSYSYDSDAATLVEGVLSPSGLLTIEEYFSSSESESSGSTITNANVNANNVPGNKHFLTTIEELTDECSSSRGSTPLTSPKAAHHVDECVDNDDVDEDSYEENQEMVQNEDENEENPDNSATSSEEDEASSVSVIENKSASQSQQSFSISKREDETSSSSSESSSEAEDQDDAKEDVDEDVDEDEDVEEGETAAVTVRLPLKLCFGKTKSYKDITTVLVGDPAAAAADGEDVGVSDTEDKVEDEPADEPEEKVQEEEEEYWDEEEDDEPVVSFTISLSRQISKEDKNKTKEEEVEIVEETQQEQDTDQEEEEEEVDFWSKIVGPSTTTIKTKDKETDYWGSSATTTNEEEKEQEQECKEQEFKPCEDFWGQQVTVKEQKQEQVEKEEAKPIGGVISLGKSPSKIGMSWDNEFNFWDKSPKTIETRRFSGNFEMKFEISEDYESDSGMKSDSGQRHRQTKKVRKYKRHSSIPAGLPVLKGRRGRGWQASTDNLAIQNDPPEHRQPFSFLWSEDTFSAKLAKMAANKDAKILQISVDQPQEEEPEVVQEDLSQPEEILVDEEEVMDQEEEQEVEEQDAEKEEEPGEDLSVGWSAWEGWDQVDKHTHATTTSTCNDVEDFSPDVDVHVSLPIPVVDDQKEDVDDEVDEDDEYEYEYEVEEVEDENQGEECADVDVEELPEEEKVEVKVSEESSEDSSKSSGATVKKGLEIGEEGSENTEGNSDESFKSTVTRVGKDEISTRDDDEEEEEEDDQKVEECQEQDHVVEEEEQVEKQEDIAEIPVEIQEIPESIKLPSSQEIGPANHTHTAASVSNNCTCHIDSQLSRAESLLWRIERFLHESLSLGSEDDSGVMTDLSRPISDVDTDPDAPDDCSPREGASSDLLLATTTTNTVASTSTLSNLANVSFSAATTSTGVVLRRPPLSSSRSLREQAASNRANPNQCQNIANSPPNQPPNLRRARPQSLIMLESSLSTEFQEASNSIASAAKTRSRSAERKKYQRAKTHSRLFQLLQDESCCADGEDNDGDGDEEEEFFDCEQLPKNKTPLSFEKGVGEIGESCKKVEFSSRTTAITNTTTQQLHVDINNPSSVNARRSRLLPLPLKGILHSSGTNSGAGASTTVCSHNAETNNATTANANPTTTSTSSPSGSSGVLSPTSPQTRDRLLADIINEFHLRQKSEFAAASTSGSGGRMPRLSGGRFTKFPSKIFKLLQEEFGEEFYQTFELGQQLSPGDLLANQTLFTSGGQNCLQHQIASSSSSIVKSDSAKSTASTSSDFLEVPSLPAVLGPSSGPPRRRDFRRPKSPFNKTN